MDWRSTFGHYLYLALQAGSFALMAYLIKHHPLAGNFKSLLIGTAISQIPTMVLAIYTLIMMRKEIYSRFKSYIIK
jgi:hypothetical protein